MADEQRDLPPAPRNRRLSRPATKQTADCFLHGAYDVDANGVGRCPDCAPAADDPAAALRVAVAEALAEYPPGEIRAMVEDALRQHALDTPLAHG